MQIKYSKKNRKLIVGICLTALVVIPVVVSLFWLPYDPNEVDYSVMLQSPSAAHIFGTDDYGRDIYCRIMNGAAITFSISIFTVAVGALIGTIIGALTGYFGGIVDEILMRINDGLASFPSILLALVVVSLLDKGTWNICVALAIVFIPSFARIMRAEFISERNKDYVLNAKLMGAGHFRIIFVHILPNTLPILFSAMLVGLNNAVLAEAGLSYLGLGVQPPEPSLGRMLSEAKMYIWSAPWYEIFTCLVMIIMILGITTISDSFNSSGVSFWSVKRRIRRIKGSSVREQVTIENPVLPSVIETILPAQSIAAETSEEKDCYLKVRNLCIDFIDEDGLSATIKGVSFDLNKGEILGVVGESGSGKSLVALSILGLMAENAAITKGSILFEGKELVDLAEDELCRLRGKDISFVFQEPMTSLNPVLTVGSQVDEIFDIHAKDMPEEEKKRRVINAFNEVGLDDAESVYKLYPHELSGGMRQRVMIAMALVAEAKIIIADEPTTALDAEVADVILDLFQQINEKHGTSIILISHDLRVIGKVADRAMIMQRGQIVEILKMKRTEHASSTSNDLAQSTTTELLKTKEASTTTNDVEQSVTTELIKTKAASTDTNNFGQPTTEYGQRLLEAAFANKVYAKKNKSGKTIVELEKVNIFYKNRKKKGLKQVIFDADLAVKKGDAVGVVGESGCGKTTLVKAIAGLQKYVEGKITVSCETPGMVFQDPYSSLNPSFSVERILEEPLRLANKRKNGKKLSKEEMRAEVRNILTAIELDEKIADRKISNLSGGQRQRIAIALTVLQKRELIILDEPVSALDVTIQEQIIRLLMKLKDKYGLTYILISHDKRLVARICNVVYNVKEGRVYKKNGGCIMETIVYEVASLDGDYANLKRIDESDDDLKVVARALLPSEIYEGCMVKYECFEYSMV